MKDVVFAFLDMLLQTQHLAPETLQAHQRGLLEPLIRHAHAHVPFYRDSGRLAPLFRGDGSIDWSRWPDIPLLSRGDVQKAGKTLHSVALPPDHGGTTELTTSGSTGQPVRVIHSQLAGDLVWPAVMLRALQWYGLDVTKPFARVGSFPRINSAVVEPHYRKAWYPPFERMGLLGERLNLPESLGAAAIIEKLLALRPACISINPVQLEMLMAWDARRRLRELGEIVVMTGADRLLETTRQTVVAEYGWKALDIYASNECGLMATMCPHCGSFHAQTETVLLELLDEDDRPVSAGQKGWIVATPLYNYAMPLIRYDHADQAGAQPDSACRFTLQRLGDVVGKVQIVFEFAGGVKVRPVLPASKVIEHLGARAFQIAQVADDRCEFRVVPGTIEPGAMNFDAMTEFLRTRWWQAIQVDYRVVDQLENIGGRRKTPTFVRDMPG